MECCLKGEEIEFLLSKIPTYAPPTPGGGEWGITLIGAQRIHSNNHTLYTDKVRGGTFDQG